MLVHRHSPILTIDNETIEMNGTCAVILTRIKTLHVRRLVYSAFHTTLISINITVPRIPHRRQPGMWDEWCRCQPIVTVIVPVVTGHLTHNTPTDVS